MRADDRGTISPFIAVIALALVMVAGMVYDGGEVLAAQARARDLAGNAARAGAQEVDLDELRTSGRAVLRADRATDAANAFLLAAGASGEVVVDGARITVTVRFAQSMRILPLPDRMITATERATAVTGLDGSEASS